MSNNEDNKFNIVLSYSDKQVETMFRSMGHNVFSSVESLPNDVIPDVLVFSGGADVCPLLYGHVRNRRTHSDLRRDRRDIKMHNLFKENFYNIPMIGICRGAQFLNVMAGGALYQHVDNHAIGFHSCKVVFTDEEIQVSSTHHQMLIPTKNADIIAFADESTVKWKEGVPIDVKNDASNIDPEVVWYDEHNYLCFQPHPEYVGDKNKACFNLFKDTFDWFIVPVVSFNRKKRENNAKKPI